MIIKNNTTHLFPNALYCRDFDNYVNFDFKKHNTIKKKYNTEIILITNSDNLKNLYGFINWYINILKFDHIILIDNYTNNRFNKFSKFKNVTYKHKPEILLQSEIYNEYVNNSQAKWVLPIDDDEFLYISEKFGHNINTFLKYMEENHFAYKYSFEWHMMFSKTIFKNIPDDLYINKYIYTSFGINTKIDQIHLIKTIVNTDIRHLYCNDNANPCLINEDGTVKQLHKSEKESFNYNVVGTVHNPISKKDNNIYDAFNYTANKSIKGLYYTGPIIINSDVFIAHYKYRSVIEYQNKINNYKFPDILTNYVNSNYKIDTIYDVYDNIKYNITIQSELFNLYNDYINNL